MKKFLSLLLSSIMVLSLLPVQMIGVNAEETSGVKAPLFNLSNYQNTELFKKYVRSTKGGKPWNNSLTMSAGPLFVVTGRDNSYYRYSYGFNEKEETVSMLWDTRFLRQNDGKSWKATFKFKMNSDSYSEYGEFMKMLDAGQIKMRFGGNFHNYGGGRPSMKFMGKGIDGSDLPDDASVEKDSGWFSVSKNDLLYNEIVMSGSGSGTNSAINHPFVQFADLTKPSIKNVSVSRGTLYLDMGEPLKKIGDLSNMKLNLILSNPETGIQSEKRTAVATYINGNKIAFSIDDEGLDEYQVTKIESFECGGEYQSELMGVSLADNYLFSTYYHEAVYKHVDNAPGGMGEYTKSSTPAVDLAGNNVEITAKDLTPYKLVVDRIKPVVAAAEISGSMITNDSTKYSQASDWPEDIDRSSVFAGIGDTLTFSVITSEEVEVNERNGKISVDLNINDENGKPISLDYDKLENMYDGVNKRPATRITFKPLTITDKMSTANKNESIRPIKINASWLFDNYGNAFNSTELSVVPRQQLYFDNELPTVKIDTITGDVNSGDFCVPLTISDGEADRITSGTTGLSADFAWIYDGDAQHEYKYAITTSAQTPADSEFKTSVLGNKNGSSWNKFDLPVNEYYLHIKTDADEIKNTELKFKLNDWAGNSGERSAEIPQISIDRTAPQIELVSINTTYTNAAEGSSAKVKADIAINDFNMEGLRAQYVIADSKDADNIADLNEASVSDDGKFSVEMTYSETVDKVLVVTATDAKGNNSETARFPFSVDLTKASANYTINSDLSKLNQKPDIRVSAPNNPNAREYAQTRVVLKMGDNYYVRVYDTDEQKNIFDFDGQWYKITYNENKMQFETVEPLTDTSELANYYGVVKVSFDSAFAQLTPAVGLVTPSNQEQAVTYRSEGGFDVMYAPLSENLHNVTFADKFTSNGSDLEPNVKSGSSKHITKQTSMSDVRLKFNISNSRMNEWGIKNLDLDKSYISVTTLGGTEVYRTKLSRNSEQTFSMPDWDMNGDKLKTDAYYVTVYLYQVGSDTPQKFGYDTAVVLDDTTPSTDTGIKKYYILPNVNFKNISLEASIPEISKESETTFNVINLGAAKWQETERSEEEGYAKTTDGFFIFKLTLSTKNVSKNILGERIGEIEGFRLWNKACTGGENLEFKSGKAVSEELYSKEFEIRSVEKISDSLSGTAASGDLQLAKGLNTLCYQVKLANGNISPVYEMTINVTDNAPQIALDMKINESQNYSDENSIHALSVDASVVNAFSPNGDVKLYYINKGKDANNLAARFDEIKLGDTVNFTADSRQNYQTYTEKDNSDTKNANYAFLALDDSGNSAIIYPQFKDDTNYMFEHETLNFTRFSLDSSNYSFYRYVLDGANVDLSKSTLIINDGEEIPLIGSELPNEYGYDGAMISDDGKLKLDFAKPWDADKNGENFITKLTVNRVGIHGDKRTETYEVNPTDTTTGLSPITYSKPEYRMWDDNYNRGTRIDFNSFVKIKGDDDYTVGNPRYYPIFSDGTYNIEVTDAFGVDYTIPVDVNVWGSGPQVDVSPIYKTRDKVTVNVAYENNVTLTEKEGNSFAEITGSGTNSVTAVVSQPTDLIMKWTDSSGEHERTMYIGNNEIKPIDPEIKWDYSENDIVDGNCVYESVTATVIDKNGSTLKDAVTGEGLSHTFYPGGETEYTFSGYVNQHGDKGADITASLPVTVIEYPAPSEWKDTTAPSVQMLGYTVKNSVAEDKKLVLNLYDQDKELTNPALVNYGDGYTVTEDTSSFVDKMGFAAQYRFNVYAADESAVKLIAKSGLVTDSPKFNEQGDSIDGVNVSGRAVDITKNVQFTLFAVDSYDNAKAIQFDIDSIGNIPEPVVEKVVSNDGRQVKVYLVPKDNDVTDIKMTDNSLNLSMDQESEGEYSGCWYLTAKENGTANINCTYKYKGKETNTAIKVDITEIDEKKADCEIIWSANADSESTNKNVTAQLRFNKVITDISLKDAPTDTPDIYRFDNQITLTYSKNTPKLTLVCKAINGTETEINLPAVENIDKIAPQITSKVEPTATAKSVKITLSANEDVIFTEGGVQGREFTRYATANGDYVYHFIDKAGNAAEITVTVSGIVTNPLTLSFSLSASGAGEKTSPEMLGNVKVGDTVYVKANRACEINWIGSAAKTAVSDSDWTALSITEDNAGLTPGIAAVDNYGNTRYYHFSQIAPLDKIAPMIRLKKNTIDISFALTDDEIKAALKDNAVVSDNITAADKIAVDAVYTKPQAASTIGVKYIAADESGNISEKYGYIHFFRDTELRIRVNGDGIFREMVKICDNAAQSIVVNSGGEPYSVYMKNGIKTAGQMKIGSTALAKDKSDSNPIEFVPKKAGYYTFLVRTQGQDAYRFVLYVKDGE